jgi:putative transposase
MSGKGNCYDNAMVESFVKTIKIEMIWRTKFNSSADAHDAIARYIDGFYNPIRQRSALNYLSPVQFEKRAAN